MSCTCHICGATRVAEELLVSKAAADTSQAAFEAILRLVNAMVAGRLPQHYTLLDSNLVAVQKPGGRGEWPLAISEAWVRITTQCGLAVCPDANASLAPLQLAVGVRGGTEAADHALRAALAADPTLVLVRIDYENAFNTVSCTAVMKVVTERAPQLLAFVKWVYNQPPGSESLAARRALPRSAP
jgi:hypothetical protein